MHIPAKKELVNCYYVDFYHILGVATFLEKLRMTTNGHTS